VAIAVVQLAKTLTESRDFIIKKAANELFRGRPNLVSPGGNAFGKEMTATCLRDMDYYLRLITYSVVTGDTTPIQEIGIIGAREMYGSLGTPLDAMAESVRQDEGDRAAHSCQQKMQVKSALTLIT
jgi:allophycocyanin alpha subunit